MDPLYRRLRSSLGRVWGHLRKSFTWMHLDIVMGVRRLYCIHGRLSLVDHGPLGSGCHPDRLWGQSLRGPDLGPPCIYLGQGKIRSAGTRRFCDGRQASTCAGLDSQRQAGMHQFNVLPPVSFMPISQASSCSSLHCAWFNCSYNQEALLSVCGTFRCRC